MNDQNQRPAVTAVNATWNPDRGLRALAADCREYRRTQLLVWGAQVCGPDYVATTIARFRRYTLQDGENVYDIKPDSAGTKGTMSRWGEDIWPVLGDCDFND